MVMLQKGRVIDGKIVIEDGRRLKDGELVTVLVPEPGDVDELTPELEAELVAAIAEADRGELVDIEVVFAKLKRS
jgi:hypothetical protein